MGNFAYEPLFDGVGSAEPLAVIRSVPARMSPYPMTAFAKLSPGSPQSENVAASGIAAAGTSAVPSSRGRRKRSWVLPCLSRLPGASEPLPRSCRVRIPVARSRSPFDRKALGQFAATPPGPGPDLRSEAQDAGNPCPTSTVQRGSCECNGTLSATDPAREASRMSGHPFPLWDPRR